MDNNNLVVKSVKNVQLLVLLQILSKILTSVLNFLIARFVSKEVFGYASIELQLFYSLVLFFTKEALRRTCQRDFKGGKQVDEQTKFTSCMNLVSIFDILVPIHQ